MMKNIGMLCAATIVSAGLLAVPAEARDGYERRCDIVVGPGIGAVAGDILGAELNRGRGDTGPYSWRNPNAGYYGDFRINRTYGRYRDDRDRIPCTAYQRTMCREYMEMHPRPGRYSETHVACLASDGTWRVVN